MVSGVRNEWPEVADIFSECGRVLVGVIKYNSEREMVSAHCRWCDPSAASYDRAGRPIPSHYRCKVDRSVSATLVTKHKGRPLAQLINWLRLAPECIDTKAHQDKCASISMADRLRVRDWGGSESGGCLPVFNVVERRLRPGEPREHDLPP